MQSSAPALTVSNLACRRGGRPVLSGLSFEVAPGELLALTGPNGAGKTTLLRALALLLPIDSGTISFNGTDVAADRDAWRTRLGWLGHLDGLKGDLSVAENIEVANRLRGTQRPIDEALAAFDLAKLAHRPARTLSAGQRRRAATARLVASGANVWLLDEPLNALDTASQDSLLTVLSRHLQSGGLAIAATHAPIAVAGARSLDLISRVPPHSNGEVSRSSATEGS
jgi:heme exporter protein A